MNEWPESINKCWTEHRHTKGTHPCMAIVQIRQTEFSDSAQTDTCTQEHATTLIYLQKRRESVTSTSFHLFGVVVRGVITSDKK